MLSGDLAKDIAPWPLIDFEQLAELFNMPPSLAPVQPDHQIIAQRVLGHGRFYDTERGFLHKMTQTDYPSVKQLAWLEKIKYRNHF
jgi:hypothetical protein